MIRFENVSIAYDRKSQPALDDVSIDVQRGEFVFLVGSSGSGKSTMLRLVLREYKTPHGQIYVAGQNVANVPSWRVPKFRRGIGVVFQDFRLIQTKTVFANVAYAMQVLGKSRAAIRAEVPRVLELVGLADKGRRLPTELSGGEQQRVAIARAIVNQPGILLADEPTGNLDPITSAGIMDILDKINQNGTTVVMATHDDDIVNTMRKRVIELQHGKVVRDEAMAQYTSMIPIVPTAGGQSAVGPAEKPDAEPQTRRQRAVSVAEAGDGAASEGEAGNVEPSERAASEAAEESMPPRLERRRAREAPLGGESNTSTENLMNEDQK
ncbi:cell division ATP-binding protein FtsE [Arthrobacter sp. H35-D1]|uniref:cell division ATP-binding protein FtsE n=1 Tax=Arthrobacter sp. H35-D1 TaxID=3046202 RepID=UPI0024BAD756|nr:cell division ATP-binding protein FtsE [Arthrobacter sp. H35-D1]MDJ0312997.1 cell division ATP-binding protein FtsE [Arthrobacter sp. H35-D1]